MKIAVSSASFGRALVAGDLTHLEWLDACANELEADAVVFDAAHFPRTDDEYLAQLKKSAVDLGLAVAAVASQDAFASDGDAVLAMAERLGAPLAIGRAPLQDDDPGAWPAFVEAVKAGTRAAKARNVTLAVRNVPGTLCATTADLRALAKDVDSAWLRFALDPPTLGASDPATPLLGDCVIAVASIADLERFAMPDDRVASTLLSALARFRGCVLVDGPEDAPRAAFCAAYERFAAARARALGALGS